MSHITISKARKDGKFPVRIAYEGAPNMFGGRDYPKVYNKLYSLEKVKEVVKSAVEGSTVINNSYQSFEDSDNV